MDVLQWVFIIGISLTILSVMLTGYFVVQFITKGSKAKSLKSLTTKSKRKKKKQATEFKQAKQGQKKALRNMVIWLVLSSGFAGGAYYVTYYQSTNLSLEDTQAITDGYYYLRDLKTELEGIQGGSVEEEKSKQTLTFVATSLAGYSVKKANTLNTVDGQSVLNKYYHTLSELGINLSRQSSTLLTNAEGVADLLKDVEKAGSYQRKAFKFYKVDESALQAEK